jgi:hypothetical protein
VLAYSRESLQLVNEEHVERLDGCGHAPDGEVESDACDSEAQ